MTKVHRGSVFGIRELTEDQRAKARKDLELLEKELIRCRKRLDYWTLRKTQAETIPGIPEDLRQSTFYFHARAQEQVNSTEKVRAYLIAELQGQPEHLPAYHYEH
ncbi:hypothetical protein AB0V79_27035 [Mesorhizobium ciceri]|uniref:hypothetical protein n=1 Tax=Mesorhizobium ciceri TaxID=39645 RepID=UPI0007A95905|nr:hypothetical protein [Mesorhizobium ciceri]AMY00722.1 hypothetical protein A4R29_15380 [Mesorhizobium ciceri biovar biserrulae]